MPTRRSLAGYLFVGYVMSLSTNLAQVEGRKCVCTSKACKEAGVDTCRTRFFCYTEFIVTSGQQIGESTITRGCTEVPRHCCAKQSPGSRGHDRSTPWNCRQVLGFLYPGPD